MNALRLRAGIAVLVLTVVGCASTSSSKSTTSLRTVPQPETPTTRSKAEECRVAGQAAKAASALSYANTDRFPTTFAQLTKVKPPVLVLDGYIAEGGKVFVGNGWRLTMNGSGTAPPAFTCET
jgi:hypothetical protein